jgi:hypothetical protein
LDVYTYYGGEYAWRAGYIDYMSDAISTSQVIVSCTVNTTTCPQGFALQTVTTHKTSNTGIGGYGNIAANNSGCSNELVPSGTFTPSGGGACAGDIRLIQEGTVGFWHKFYQGPRGGMRWGVTYSYITKSGWSGAGGNSPKANDNMVWTSFRYYLP